MVNKGRTAHLWAVEKLPVDGECDLVVGETGVNDVALLDQLVK